MWSAARMAWHGMAWQRGGEWKRRVGLTSVAKRACGMSDEAVEERREDAGDDDEE